MIELVFMASVASSSFDEPSPLSAIDSVVLIASAPSSPSIPPPPPVPSTPAPVSGSGSQPVYPSPQQQPRFQPQQQQPKQSWADKMWRRYNENKGRN